MGAYQNTCVSTLTHFLCDSAAQHQAPTFTNPQNSYCDMAELGFESRRQKELSQVGPEV